MSGWRLRGIGLAGVAATLALSACGGGSRQDVSEPKGKFQVSVPTASFPVSQQISQHSRLVITVRNEGRKTIPDVAVTICNVTCAFPAPNGEGTNAAAFASDITGQYLANPARPSWVVDQGPGLGGLSASDNGQGQGQGGGQGGAVTAVSNTWALGPLRPGGTATFKWRVTALSPGTHVVAWRVAAGLNGKARAVLSDGRSVPQGRFTVRVANNPAESFVDNNGRIVNTPNGPAPP